MLVSGQKSCFSALVLDTRRGDQRSKSQSRTFKTFSKNEKKLLLFEQKKTQLHKTQKIYQFTAWKI